MSCHESARASTFRGPAFHASRRARRVSPTRRDFCEATDRPHASHSRLDEGVQAHQLDGICAVGSRELSRVLRRETTRRRAQSRRHLSGFSVEVERTPA